MPCARKLPRKIAGTVLAGEIEQPAAAPGKARRDQPHQIGQRAVGRRDVAQSRPRVPPRRCAPDRKGRKAREFRRARMRRQCARRIRAGHQHGAVRSRRIPHRSFACDNSGATSTVMPTRAQCLRGARRIGFRPRDQQAHVRLRRNRRGARRFNSAPASAPSVVASRAVAARLVSNASLPSGRRIMPRKRDRIAVEHRMPGDRRAARAVEHGRGTHARRRAPRWYPHDRSSPAGRACAHRPRAPRS